MTSKFLSSTDKIELSAELYHGRYAIVAYHEWCVNKSGRYYTFLSSQSHITLKKGGFSDHDFLVKTLLSMETMRVFTAKEEKEECTIRLEV